MKKPILNDVIVMRATVPTLECIADIQNRFGTLIKCHQEDINSVGYQFNPALLDNEMRLEDYIALAITELDLLTEEFTS